MKKLLLLLSIMLLFEIQNVNAETLTITFDANDGSGRTKVVQYEKGPSYKMLGADSFKYLDDDLDDPMDDKVIKGWSKTPNGGTTYEANRDITRPKNTPSDQITSYDVLNNADEITLYGFWTERKDVNYMINSFTVTGEGVTQKENGDYDIPLDSSAEFQIVLKESIPSGDLAYQFSELSYIDLPDSFFEYFPDYVLEAFSNPESIPITISYSGNTYPTTHAKKYVKDHKLFIDIISDGSYGAQLINSSTNITLRFNFYGRVKMIENNGHMVRGVTLSYEIPDDTVEEDYLFPQGKIISKYVDIDTGKELAEEEISEDIIWTKYALGQKKINNYELIEYPEEDVYYLDNEQQTLYYKYRKIANSPSAISNILDNPNTSRSIAILALLLTIIVGSFYIYKIKRKV